MASKEIDFAMSHIPAEDAESFRSFLSKDADGRNAQRMAGKAHSRSDYKCMVKASDPDEIRKCIETVNKRLGNGHG